MRGYFSYCCAWITIVTKSSTLIVVSDPVHASGTKRNVKQVVISESLKQNVSQSKLKVTLLTVRILWCRSHGRYPNTDQRLVSQGQGDSPMFPRDVTRLNYAK